MARAAENGKALKKALKEAMAETLQEQRQLLREVFVEALEDLALVETIQEGKKSKPATRRDIPPSRRRMKTSFRKSFRVT